MIIPSELIHTTSETPQRTWWQKLRRFFLKASGFLLLVSVLAVVALRWLPVPTSMFMLYRHFEDAQSQRPFNSIRYEWVDYQQISPYASQAVIASEDQFFLTHSGFDIPAIKSSIQVYLKGGRLRGASTISQQVAKNLFLTPAKSLIRKGIEAWFTFLIENFWTKARILEVYLNIAEFGDHLFGINVASRHYFGIDPQHITKQQAALLAATLPNPLIYQAAHPSRYVYKRQRWILRQMRNLDFNALGQ